jgi:S1-C subfamily serine protease
VALSEAQKAAAGGQETALLVTGVTADGPAAKAGMQVGDILFRLGAQALRDTGDLQAALGPETPGQTLTASVLRGGGAVEVAVAVGERA